MTNTRKEPYSQEDVATILTSYLPEQLTDYFYNHLLKNAANVIEEYIYNEYIIPSGFVFQNIDSTNLKTFVNFLLWESFREVDGHIKYTEREALEHYALKRKNRKDYLRNVVRSEYQGKPTALNPKHLKRGYDTVSSPYYKNTLEPGTRYVPVTQEEFFEQEYKKVTAWHKKQDSYLFQYPYFDTLSDKKRIEDFIIDLGYYIFSLICTDLYRSRYGFVTQSADIAYSPKTDNNTTAVINWQTSPISTDELMFESTKDSIQVYELIPGENGNTRIIIDVIHDVDCSTPQKTQNEIEKLRSGYNAGNKIGRLDATDHAIITAIINNITFSIATTRENFTITFNELARDVYATSEPLPLKKRHDLFKRLQKLQKMSISFSENAENGVPIYGETISFLNFSYKITNTDDVPDSNDTGLTINTTKVLDISGDASIANTELFQKIHYSNMILYIEPSGYLKDQWLNGMHTRISSKTYQKVTSQKGKLLLQILQTERLRIYPETHMKMTLIFLKTKIRLASGKSSRFKTEIKEELQYFVENKIIISAFTTNRSSFNITFLPFDNNEKIILGITKTAEND